MTAVTPGRTGNQFNLAAQARRQAGSTFKTYVLAEAIAEGVNPDTTSYALGAPALPARPVLGSLGRLDLLAHLPGLDLDHQRDASPRTTPSSPG